MRDYFKDQRYLFNVDGELSTIDWSHVPVSGGVHPGDLISGGVWASILSRYSQLRSILDNKNRTATYSRDVLGNDIRSVLDFANRQLYSSADETRRFVWNYPRIPDGRIVDLTDELAGLTINDVAGYAQRKVAPLNPAGDDAPWKIEDDLSVIRASTMNALQELFTAPPSVEYYLNVAEDSRWTWECSATTTVTTTQEDGDQTVETSEEPLTGDMRLYYRDVYLTSGTERVTTKAYHWSNVQIAKPSSFKGMFGHLDYNGTRGAFRLQAEKCANFVSPGGMLAYNRKIKHYLLYVRADRGLMDGGLMVFAGSFSNLLDSVENPEENKEGWTFVGRTDTVSVMEYIHGGHEYAVSM
jgi:hypothetical protein